MTATAELFGSDGRPITPGDLVWRSIHVDGAFVAAARHHAHRHGRLIERDEAALFCFDEAARIELPRGIAAPGAPGAATALLSALRDRDDAESSPAAPIALGALSFDPAHRGTLVIPRLVVLSDHHHGGVAIVVALRSDNDDLDLAFEEKTLVAGEDRADGEAPERFEMASVRSEDDYRRRVRAAVAAIKTGELDKVVLARKLAITADRAFRQHDLVARMRELHPTCATFAIDGFVGATPELLIARRGRLISSRPLAGTVARRFDADDDEVAVAALRSSLKERSEHRFVVDDVMATFRRHAEEIEAPDEPEVVRLANVTHLSTPLSARLRQQNDERLPSAFDLAAELHPTAAVAGTPRQAALAYLRANEGFDRDRYAGPVGWFDASGDGEWWIGIRSALVDGATARLVAGNGIVADSDPDAELEETAAKFEALIAVFTDT